MKIKTLTCHDVYNCGASLQAYALQRYLSKLGHDVEIINYKPSYLSFKYRWHWYVNEHSPYYKRCRGSVLYRAFYVTQRYLRSFTTWKRKRSFELFTYKYLKLTKEYDTYIQLCQNPPQADVYIVGSDQVWNNAVLNNGFDPAFFLSFGNKNTKRLSYAASFGTAKSYMTFFTKQRLASFDAISVREDSGKRLIGPDFDVKVVCDPVFLLDKEDWENMCVKVSGKNERFILIYNLGNANQNMLSHAYQLAKERKMKVYVIKTSESMIKADKVFSEVGPIEFLSLFSQASVVLSNSFHATAFSLIFRKEFYTYTFQEMASSYRMVDLLNRVGLSSRFNPEDISHVAPLDYNVHDYCGTMVNESKQWLLTQLDKQK